MFDISQFIATIINFIVCLIIAKYLFWNKIQGMLSSRENYIKDKINKIEEDERKAKELKLENEMCLKQSKEKGKDIVAEYKNKAQKVYDELVNEAKRESSLTLERAKVEIQREKDKARDDMEKEIIDTSILLCTKVLQESIDDEKHIKLIKDFISKVGN